MYDNETKNHFQLSVEQIVRAWQDPQYFQSLTEDLRRLVPANPAGEITTIFADALSLTTTETYTTGFTFPFCQFAENKVAV